MPARVAVLAVLLSLATAVPAAAEDVCVIPRGGCAPASTYQEVQAALDSAAADADADRVLLGAKTYEGSGPGFAYDAPGAPVEIAGVAGTVLVAPAGVPYALNVAAAGGGSSVHDLTLRIAGGADPALGLVTAADAARVTVEEIGDPPGERWGVRLLGGADLLDSTVRLDRADHTKGVHVSGAGSTVRDVEVRARYGYENHGVGASFDRVRGDVLLSGIAALASTTIRNCVITLAAGATIGSSAIYALDAGSVGVVGCTLVGNTSQPDTSGLTVATNSANTSLTATSVVVRGFDHALRRQATGGKDASLGVSYSDLDATQKGESGPGAITIGTGVAFHPDARFLDAAAGDLRLRHDSPLVDRGSTSAGFAGPVDVLGLPRIVDGDGAGGARVDAGAFEYQRSAPVVALAGPATGVAGEALTFTASATDADPGEAAAFAWKVDGVAAGAGPTLTRTLAAGAHTVEVVATDPAGVAAAASKGVAVTAPPAEDPGGGGPGAGAGPGGGPGAGTGTGAGTGAGTGSGSGTGGAAEPAPSPPAAPRLTGLTVRRGVARFTVDRAAEVVLQVVRERRGTRRGRRCGPARPTGRRCTRLFPVRRIVVRAAAGTATARLGRLRRGPHRVVAVATAGGLSSPPAAKRFRGAI